MRSARGGRALLAAGCGGGGKPGVYVIAPAGRTERIGDLTSIRTPRSLKPRPVTSLLTR